MIETIKFKDKTYPKFQAEHFAAQFVFPFADKVLTGVGFDIGYGKLEWMLPNKINRNVCGIENKKTYSAMKLPKLKSRLKADFIFSSHCLEHIETPPFDVLNYWHSKLKSEGTLFLYLPDFSQKYWRPWHNSKHKHVISRKIIKHYLKESGKWKNVFVSGIDLNNSFIAIAEAAK